MGDRLVGMWLGLPADLDLIEQPDGTFALAVGEDPLLVTVAELLRAHGWTVIAPEPD